MSRMLADIDEQQQAQGDRTEEKDAEMSGGRIQERQRGAPLVAGEIDVAQRERRFPILTREAPS